MKDIIIFLITIVGLVFIIQWLASKFQIKRNEISRLSNELEILKVKYKDVIDIDKIVETRSDELKSLEEKIAKQKYEYDAKTEQLNNDYISKRNVFEDLLKEISILEENLEDISYGLYKPHFDYNTSEEYKKKLNEIWNETKNLIRSGKAVYSATEWRLRGSIAEGRTMIKNSSKLMLRAFNGECDSTISKVIWNNVVTFETRISKAFEAINKLGLKYEISITKEYLDLKLMELRLEYELQEKIHEEREEQRKIRLRMYEEQKVQQEIEKVKQDAEEEEQRFQKALKKAKSEISKTTGAELVMLNDKITSLEENLRKAQEQKARAISRAQQTKSGHVYIISNIGSFGENVYKFGMTRRLDPQDRIDELGNASVPFDFDVHGLIYSDNAPELENKLHKHLNDRRINLVRMRREFFKVTIDEIEEIVKEFNLEVQLTKLAEAKEYRMSLSKMEAKEKQLSEDIEKLRMQEFKFPASLINLPDTE